MSINKHDEYFSELNSQICANRSLIYLCTYEEQRVLDVISKMCSEKSPPWSYATWDIASGLSGNNPAFTPKLTPMDQSGVLAWFDEQKVSNDDYLILVLKDFYKFLSPEGFPGQTEIEVIRQLRNLAEKCSRERKAILLIGTKYFLPPELEKYCSLIDWPLPEKDHIKDKVTSLLSYAKQRHDLKEKFKLDYNNEEMDEIVKSFMGLTIREVELLTTYFFLTKDQLFPGSIAQKKRDIIRKNGLVEWIDLDINFDGVGGLSELKGWLQKRKLAFSDEALAYGLPENPKGVLMLGIQGSGKCFEKDTEILMFNGDIKRIQDIKVGDKVMGIDSTPRNVLNLTHGRDVMYEIIPKKGEPYTVNSSHILAVKHSGIKKTYKEFDNNGLLNINLDDYLNKSDSFKQRAMGYRRAVDFPYIPTNIDPYFIGLWLGDGTSSGSSVTAADEEIVSYLYDFVSLYNLNIRKTKSKIKNKKSDIAHTYFITSGKLGKGNVIIDILKELNLLNNKHIPKKFLCNSRDVRLNVLAGLIDSDGHLANNGYDIIQKSVTLANNIVYLARSLGLAAYMHSCEKTCTNSQDKKPAKYWRVSISGNTNIIPTKVKRKQASARKQIKDVLNFGFKVQKKNDIGEYFGFTIDKDNLFLLGDFTVVHNSLSSKAIAYFWKLPLIRLDVGKIFSGIVGSSEENLRNIIKLVESVAPCVLWIDEIDKGMGSTGTNDGGVTARVFATLLTWMQEKQSPVFVVATANDVSTLPPELLRKGRFDEIFFVDLPDSEERKDIFKIHLLKRNRDFNMFDLNELVKHSDGYTGAEIEASIVAALYESFDDGKRELITDDIINALEETVPISETMKEKINTLRAWAYGRARNASKKNKTGRSEFIKKTPITPPNDDNIHIDIKPNEEL